MAAEIYTKVSVNQMYPYITYPVNGRKIDFANQNSSLNEQMLSIFAPNINHT